MQGLEIWRSSCSLEEKNTLPCEPRSHVARRRSMENISQKRSMHYDAHAQGLHPRLLKT